MFLRFQLSIIIETNENIHYWLFINDLIQMFFLILINQLD